MIDYSVRRPCLVEGGSAKSPRFPYGVQVDRRRRSRPRRDTKERESRTVGIELLAATGVLTEQLRRDVILGLSATDYCDGPLANEVPGHKGGIWIFGASVGGEETYIKLTIEPVKDENGAIVKLAKCLSFHPADRVLEYPFRAKGESE